MEVVNLIRSGPEPRLDVLHVANLEVRPGECLVLADGRALAFTRRELEVLLVLAQRAGRVVQRPEIYDLVWGGAIPHRDRSVDVFVRKVRQKLAAACPEWTYVHTHFGVGYRFSAEQA